MSLSTTRSWKSLFRSSLTSRTTKPKRNLRLEQVESRVLLAADIVTAAGPEFQVNQYTTHTQYLPSIASDDAGNFVITWTSNNQDGSSYGVYAQRYAADGTPLGNEFRVNQYTSNSQNSPSVASDDAGNFVITWTTAYQDGNGLGVYARRYAADGTPLGNEFQVNQYTSSNQYVPSVASDDAGNFVITWSSYNQDGSNYGIYARRYAADGSSLGNEFQVNQHTSSSQIYPSVASDDAGNFVITWSSQNQDGSSYGIFARRYAADGTPLENEFQVNQYTSSDQLFPSVASDDAGNFVITWSSYNQDGSDYGIYARRYDDSGSPIGGEFRVNTYTFGTQITESFTGANVVAMDDQGNFIVTWQSSNQDGSGWGVFAQRYAVTPPTVVKVASSENLIINGSTHVTALDQFDVIFNEVVSSSGIHDVTNPANWILELDGTDIGHRISHIDALIQNEKTSVSVQLDAPIKNGTLTLGVRDSVTDLAGRALDGDGDGIEGGNFQLTFDIDAPLALGTEFKVNETTSGNQAIPSVSTDAAGNSVITWSSLNQDGSSYGIYAQRYAADGTPLGNEFQVNQYTSNSQNFPSVASDDAGNFVITWSSQNQDGSSYGIYARRYAADGTPLANEFQVNQYTSSIQIYPSVASDDAGNFVITWSSYNQDGSAYGIYARRYAADGTSLGGEFQVNQYTSSDQLYPSVASDDAGNFVISWTSQYQDGSGYGIYARRYAADGSSLGGEFQVNQYTTSNQHYPSVASDDAGNFVITWQSANQDGSSNGIYARRYAADGTPLGNEFQVNQYTIGSQFYPSVASDDAGNFVITWTCDNQDGSAYGIYARRYDDSGSPIGDEFRVNTYIWDRQQTDGYTGANFVAMDDQGKLIVTWQSVNQDGSGWGIYAQRFAFRANSAPVANAGGTYTVGEGSPLTLDASASTDPDGDVLTFAWDLDGDGDFDDAVGVSPTVSWATLFALGLGDNGIYTISVQATDDDGETHTDSATLVITNVHPSFDSNSIDPILELEENSGNGTVVGTLTATDPAGLNDPLAYSITGGTSTAAFQIDAGTGVISVADASLLDFETTPVFVLDVTVSDDDGGSAETKVTITLLNQASISGSVFLDTDRDSIFEGNEIGLDGIVVELLDLSGNVLESVETSDGGFYLFEDYSPGDYLIREIQPSGVDNGVAIAGSIGGTYPAEDTIGVTLNRTDATDYLFSEYGQSVGSGDSASIGYWQNKHGQSLIAAGGTQLANWLTDNFGNIFGDQFANATGQDIADFYRDELFKQKGKKAAGPAKVDAHFMAVTFSTFFTSSNLAGNIAEDYGFNVTDLGLGAKVINVGSAGAAFNVADNTELTVLQLLYATNSLTDISDNQTDFAYIYDSDGDGEIDSDEARMRNLANGMYSLITSIDDN